MRRPPCPLLSSWILKTRQPIQTQARRHRKQQEPLLHLRKEKQQQGDVFLYLLGLSVGGAAPPCPPVDTGLIREQLSWVPRGREKEKAQQYRNFCSLAAHGWKDVALKHAIVPCLTLSIFLQVFGARGWQRKRVSMSLAGHLLSRFSGFLWSFSTLLCFKTSGKIAAKPGWADMLVVKYGLSCPRGTISPHTVPAVDLFSPHHQGAFCIKSAINNLTGCHFCIIYLVTIIVYSKSQIAG